MAALRDQAARTAIWLALAAALGGAAILTHAAAARVAAEEGIGNLGPVSQAIVAVLLVVLVALACRHLALLALSALDRWQQVRGPAAAGAAPPFVSIIVPAFNEAPMIGEVLESLLAIRYARFEVIVVDDGSSDQTFLRALPFRRRRAEIDFRVLAKPNGGKFDALNHGIARARGEIVVCIDGDSLLEPDALRHLVAHFDDPRVGAVAGRVRVANRGTAWSALQALEYVVGYGLNKRAQSAARAVTIVPGPLGAFRKRALSQVGGYDGDTFAEDFDLTLKLLGAGWHAVYEPRAVVRTEAPERTLELLRQRYRWTRGSLQVLRKRARALARPRSAPLAFLGLWVLALEHFALPMLHVAAQALFVAGGLAFGAHELVIYWWLQLVLLECAVVAFCVAVEDESVWLVALGPPFRVFYLLVLDVARLLASCEELAAVRMGWDKIARLGTFKSSSG